MILPVDEVHIWFSSVDDAKAHLHGLWAILAEDEKERANQFYFNGDRVRYIVSHGLLRSMLSYYTKTEPDKHIFSSNQYGKPSVLGIDIPCFNMSHSGDKILYGFTCKREIGVDIELVQSIENVKQIIDRFFSKQEKLEFSKLPKHLTQEAFYTCWVRKEAFIKAQGKGLSMPLDQFSVSFLQGEPAKIFTNEHDKKEMKSWSLKNISIHPKYKAAVVFAGQELTVKTRQWSWE